MVYFKENCNFPRFQRGRGLSIFPGGGVYLFTGGGGGGNCLFPIPMLLVFIPGGPDPLPPPLWIHACNIWINCVLLQKLDIRKSYQF